MTRKLFRRKKVVHEDPPRLQLSFTPSGADRTQASIQAAYDLTRHWRLTNRFTQNGRMKTTIGYLLRFGERVQALGEPVPASLRVQRPESKPGVTVPCLSRFRSFDQKSSSSAEGPDSGRTLPGAVGTRNPWPESNPFVSSSACP